MDQDFKYNISINNYLWQIQKYSDRDVLTLQQKNNLSEIIAKILVIKNISSGEVEDYLNPTIRRFLPDPLHFLDMDKASSRIAEAITSNQNIVIFGDYDVDGATSSALFKRFFDMCGAKAQIYIPDRITEGYGPSAKAFSKFKENNTNLVITVDCGTTSFEAVDYANSVNLDVIIVDHHISAEKFPNAYALINPNRIDETTEYKTLAAVGVVFMVLVATLTKLKALNYFKDKQTPNLLELLDLVAVGTICDVVALENLNRAFVVQGLKVLSKRSNIGLGALIDVSGISEAPSVYHLGYMIGPRINAGGRIGESKLGSELLSTNDKDIAEEIANKLNLLNQERRAIENIIFDEALLLAEAEINSPIIFVQANGWHPGIVGIIASRLKEKYHKPTAVITITDNIGKASCRSVAGIDLGAAIINAKLLGLVDSGGGHAMAAGFTTSAEKLAELKQYLIDRFSEKMQDISSKNIRYLDSAVSVSGITIELAKDIEKLGPFGSNNPEPKFLVNDATIVKANIVASSHINFYIKPCDSTKGRSVKAIIFRATENEELVTELLKPFNSSLAFIGNIKVNNWHGVEKVEFVVIDVIKTS